MKQSSGAYDNQNLIRLPPLSKLVYAGLVIASQPQRLLP